MTKSTFYHWIGDTFYDEFKHFVQFAVRWSVRAAGKRDMTTHLSGEATSYALRKNLQKIENL